MKVLYWTMRSGAEWTLFTGVFGRHCIIQESNFAAPRVDRCDNAALMALCVAVDGLLDILPFC
jgi:hypothetical protein